MKEPVQLVLPGGDFARLTLRESDPAVQDTSMPYTMPGSAYDTAGWSC
jgi:hypothetical protein